MNDMKLLFEPGLWVFIHYVAGFLMRYALICGGLFWAFHAIARLRKYKIQRAEAKPDIIRYEILWSFSNTLCTGLVLMLMYWLVQNGHSRMYFNIDEYGWGWFLLSIPLGTLGFDTWFYWQHRALHTPWLFRISHSVHHKILNPTPFAAFAHHPIETFTEELYFVVLITVVPIHPLAFAVVGLHATLFGIVGHMGYEFFPRGFTKHWLFGWHNTSTYHNMHHSHPTGNYGLYFNWWDRIMGTNHPDYHNYYDAVKQYQAEVRTDEIVATN